VFTSPGQAKRFFVDKIAAQTFAKFFNTQLLAGCCILMQQPVGALKRLVPVRGA